MAKRKNLTRQQTAEAAAALSRLAALNLGIAGGIVGPDELVIELSDSFYTSFKLGDGVHPSRIVIRRTP
jgi:hypothetical protein